MANAREHHEHPIYTWEEMADASRRGLLVLDDSDDDDIQYLDSDSSGSGSGSGSRLSLRGFLADSGRARPERINKEQQHQGNLRRYLSFGCAILSW